MGKLSLFERLSSRFTKEELEAINTHTEEEKLREEFLDAGNVIALIFYKHAKLLSESTGKPIEEIIETKQHINASSLKEVELAFPELLESLNLKEVFTEKERKPGLHKGSYPHGYSKVPVYENRFLHFCIEGFVWHKDFKSVDVIGDDALHTYAPNHTHKFECGAYVAKGELVETSLRFDKRGNAIPTKYELLTEGHVSFRDPKTSLTEGKNGHHVANVSDKKAISFHIYAHDKAQSPHANDRCAVPFAEERYTQNHASRVRHTAEGWTVVTDRFFKPKNDVRVYDPSTGNFKWGNIDKKGSFTERVQLEQNNTGSFKYI